MAGPFSFPVNRVVYTHFMSQVAELVRLFYDQFWNQKNFAIAAHILHEQVNFRGSLGQTMVGREKICEYALGVTTSLDKYTCEVTELVADGDKAAAVVTFHGMHVAEFLGYEPTGKEVEWVGSAFFESSAGVLSEIWVLGDIEGLRALLDRNQA